MMHGYLADAKGNLLAPFRTWRNNTNTGRAADETTRLFNIPLRWSIAHLRGGLIPRSMRRASPA